MTDNMPDLAHMDARQAADYAMDNDLAGHFGDGVVTHDRRPAKMVTALRIDLSTQAELEAAAAARGIGSSTLMRLIIEEWLSGHREPADVDQLGELVRHLDAARQAAADLRRQAAA